MKLLKFSRSLLLTVTFTLLLSVPALALEDELPEEQEPVPATVCTLDELLTAIESAENGNTIILQNKILISKNCAIGQEEKRITIIPANDFDGDSMLQIVPYEDQDIVLQNIVLDGHNKSALAAIEANFFGVPSSKGTFYLTGVQVKNFLSDHSNIYINGISAIIDDCQFLDNIAQRSAGVEIAVNATAKISGCVFSGNVSRGNGGALQCHGQTQIEGTTITQNQAVNPDSAVMGGGIYIDQQGCCVIVECQISNNTAHLGGGISSYGTTLVIDTVLCKNQGLNSASDIYISSSKNFNLTYSDEMKSIYLEDNPIGFYLDDLDNRFNPEGIIMFLGESLAEDIFLDRYGAKFIFASDLPQEPPKESENPDEQESPTEPQEPNMPDTSEPLEPDTPDTAAPPELNTSDTNEPPKTDTPVEESTVPTTPPAPSAPSTPSVSSTISKPSRSTMQGPSIVQPEESPKLELTRGGATLNTAIPLVLLGYGDGQLYENDPITRAQIVVLLYRSLTDNSKLYITDTIAFADVAKGAWYYDAVTVLSSASIINGCNGLFLPNDTLTYGQLIAILTRFVEPKETPMPDGLPYTEHWSYGNIVTAIAYGWIDNATEIEPGRIITRGEAVEIVNSIFERL